MVGDTGQVTSIEIDPLTHAFAKQHLERAGYADVVLVLGDGGLGYAPRAPYDRIAITAACAEIPPPLVAQLTLGGRIIAPLLDSARGCSGSRQLRQPRCRHPDRHRRQSCRPRTMEPR